MNSGQRRFAIVTGASSGIGLELAKSCARDRLDLLIAADQPAIFAAADQLHERQREATTPQIQSEPAPPFPAQKQPKPGIEAEMRPRPNYQAARYRPAGKLEGTVALVTGGDELSERHIDVEAQRRQWAMWAPRAKAGAR